MALFTFYGSTPEGTEDFCQNHKCHLPHRIIIQPISALPITYMQCFVSLLKLKALTCLETPQE
jgi:hypothetical protein